MPESANIRALERIVDALGNFVKEMVFTGGSVVELYSEKGDSGEPRVTKDVDSIVAASTLSEYQAVEKELHRRGFINVGLVGEKGPKCRYKYEDLLLDLMPDNEKVLGFSNRWFNSALKDPIQKKLPSGRTIQLATFPRFIAIKLETMQSRGGKDLRGSHDLEDIVRLLDARKEPVPEIRKEIASIRTYMEKTFQRLLKNENFLEAVQSSAPDGFEQAERVLSVLSAVARSNEPAKQT